jgi:NADH-quinone oxidoreductase subunit A
LVSGGVFAADSAMTSFLHDYLTVALFGAIAGGLLFGVLSLGKLVRPVRPEGEKYMSYESGVDPVGDGWAQSPIRYYVFALLFVLFDVEAVFIFPWATRLEAYGWFGAVEMIVFIVLLSLGLLYAWRKKVLRWI